MFSKLKKKLFGGPVTASEQLNELLTSNRTLLERQTRDGHMYIVNQNIYRTITPELFSNGSTPKGSVNLKTQVILNKISDLVMKTIENDEILETPSDAYLDRYVGKDGKGFIYGLHRDAVGSPRFTAITIRHTKGQSITHCWTLILGLSINSVVLN